MGGQRARSGRPFRTPTGSRGRRSWIATRRHCGVDRLRRHGPAQSFAWARRPRRPRPGARPRRTRCRDEPCRRPRIAYHRHSAGEEPGCQAGRGMNGPQSARSGMPPIGPQPMIGIVDDDMIMGESLVQRLELEGYRATWWQSGEEALSRLPDTDCRVLVCDIRLPDMDGEQLFRRVLPSLGATPVIFITAFAEVEQAVRLIRAGADDYLTKPFEVESLLGKIAALCAREVAAGSGVPGREVLSASAAMRSVESEILRVKDATSPVLLLGETGVGKEVAARQLHDA